MSKEPKKRYSIPARIMELLYTDDAFFNEVLKMKKVNVSNFPKSDEWRDENGFNISFALAGYSPEDVEIETEANVLIVKGFGMDSLSPIVSETPVDFDKQAEDAFDDYTKETKPRIHIGSISRGIARRKFCVKHLISEEFEIADTVAKMEHGLLHIFIPEKEVFCQKTVEIRDNLSQLKVGNNG